MANTTAWRVFHKRVWPWVRRAAKALAVILLFGAFVSIVGYVRAPELAVATRPDSTIRVDEITGLYWVTMGRVVTPQTVDQIAEAVAASPGPISIGGGRYSQGGQTATPDGLQIDMRSYHGIVALDTAARTVTVRAGTRWRELQEAIDPHGLAVKIMQTYNNFTVGGALSVNAHGRYMGLGPVVHSVRAITLVLADGRVVRASREENPEIFFGAIGGYGALGVIADVTLDLAVNVPVRREDTLVAAADYLTWFRRAIRPDTNVIFHNADLYPPGLRTSHAVSYVATDLPVTVPDRLLPTEQNSAFRRFGFQFITGAPLGKWTRQHVLDPMMYRGNPVTWRNYEASYDVSELEPKSRARSTYVLQEYFVPVDSEPVFVPRMAAVLQAHDVNVVNVSIRHALPDSGTLLTWAPDEVFAYVLYYKQGTGPLAEREVGRWTRELIDTALASGGRYYLPYQPLATRDQFRRAYPGAAALFALKRHLDPTDKFTNALWDLYQPGPDGAVLDVTADRMPAVLPAEARVALDSLPRYVRSEGAEYLTHPEWDLVYGSEAYARWLAGGRQPSAFPYLKTVGTFWRSYVGTWRAARERTPPGLGYHVMLWTIGLSTAVEYGIKGLYETTFGRLFELARPDGGTAEERFAGQVAQDYAALINQVGWYRFSFSRALWHLWTDEPWFGRGFIRKWERRFVLSAEYGVKAVYATLIGLGSGTAYTPDALERDIVVAGWSDSLSAEVAPQGGLTRRWLDRRYARLTVGRYGPYRDALLALSRHHEDVRVAEINGNSLVTVTGTAPRGWLAPARSRVVVGYGVPTDPARLRVLLAVDARDLLDVLAAGSATGFLPDHVYDY